MNFSRNTGGYGLRRSGHLSGRTFPEIPINRVLLQDPSLAALVQDGTLILNGNYILD